MSAVASITRDSIERVPWDTLVSRMDWRPGEHVTLIGPTGRGKTEAGVKLLNLRKWCVFLGTKRKDSTQDALRDMGFRTVAVAHEINPHIAKRYIFKPPFPKGASAKVLKRDHGEAFSLALVHVREQTGWTTLVDECRYIAGTLGLSDELEMLWLQGRSEKSTIIANTQRPRYIPLEAYDQATHIFMWSDPDRNNITRVSEMAGLNTDLVLTVLPGLPKHDILYLNTVTGDIFVTNTRW
jgi:hypothetical protein